MKVLTKRKQLGFVDEVRELKEPLGEADLDAFNEWQLWYIYIGLTRLDLTLELKEGTDTLAKAIKDFGERRLGWLKDEEENFPYRGHKSMNPNAQKQR